jgi:hypothetical protein
MCCLCEIASKAKRFTVILLAVCIPLFILSDIVLFFVHLFNGKYTEAWTCFVVVVLCAFFISQRIKGN